MQAVAGQQRTGPLPPALAAPGLAWPIGARARVLILQSLARRVRRIQSAVDTPQSRGCGHACPQCFWHSSSHLLGQTLELAYGVDLTIGPALEEGFYYDCYMGDKVRHPVGAGRQPGRGGAAQSAHCWFVGVAPLGGGSRSERQGRGGNQDRQAQPPRPADRLRVACELPRVSARSRCVPCRLVSQH